MQTNKEVDNGWKPSCEHNSLTVSEVFKRIKFQKKKTPIISSETLEAINVVVGAIKETLKDEIEPEIYPQIGADVILRLLQSGLMKFS